MASSDSDKVSTHLETGGQTQVVNVSDVDVAALTSLKAGSVEITAEKEVRVRRKIDRYILPLMLPLSTLMFADQTVVGQSAILGIFKSTGMSLAQFNYLVTGLYVTLIICDYPQSLALQRFPVAKWMSVNAFLWSIALIAHAACKSFWALFWARVALAAGVAVVMPGFMIIVTMFYVREEQIARAALWYLSGSLNNVLVGLLAYGVLHINTPKFLPWQWLMIITGVITLIFTVFFWFYFPDSPATAWFLNEEERIIAVQRIKRNQTGIENKHWKKSQFIECLKDPKIYIFVLIGLIGHVPISIYYQKQIIVNKFGFTIPQTALLGCVDGVLISAWICVALWLSSIKQIGRAYTAALMFVPPLLGCVLLNTLHKDNKVGLLFSYWLNHALLGSFAIHYSWVPALVGGHTKRITSNALYLIASNTGNAIGPFMWKAKYQPRYRIPWIVVAACYLACLVLTLALRVMLVRENKRRDNEPRDTTYDDVYVTSEVDGKVVERRVEKAFLDLTDYENRDFRYVL